MAVYIIGSEDSDILKIGFSGDVPRRIRELNIGSPVKLEVLAEIFGDDFVVNKTLPNSSKDRAIERHLHLIFKRHRVKGEWFEIKFQNLCESLLDGVLKNENGRKYLRIKTGGFYSYLYFCKTDSHKF